MILKVIPGGPSENSGLLAGDKLLLANQDTIHNKGMSNDSIIAKLKGAAGSEVALQIYRGFEKKKHTFNIRRGSVPIRSVDAVYMFNDTIGVIELNRFAESSTREFKRALRKLKNKGMQALVIDLRNNPGGYLEVAVQIADEILPDGKLVTYTKNKRAVEEKYFATDKGAFQNREVYVLINERSASASEIIAGALQDNDIGTIVGRRSFGKGLVQREMQLGDGSAVRLTVSRYYTPTGRSIQKPYSNGKEDYYEEFINRFDKEND